MPICGTNINAISIRLCLVIVHVVVDGVAIIGRGTGSCSWGKGEGESFVAASGLSNMKDIMKHL